MEEEAELGSDNEDNDDVRKAIVRDDEEAFDEEDDADLADFVVHAGDEEDVGAEDDAAFAKFQRDMDLQDQMATRQAIASAIFGNNNKKRKREEMEGLTADEARKKRLIEERLKEANADNFQEVIL